jgi:hypothetical protein
MVLESSLPVSFARAMFRDEDKRSSKSPFEPEEPPHRFGRRKRAKIVDILKLEPVAGYD